jgi:hypothetical protein
VRAVRIMINRSANGQFISSQNAPIERKPYTTLTIEQKAANMSAKLKNPQLYLELGREYRVGKKNTE